MLVIECQEYFEKVTEFAKKIGKYEDLQEDLNYLGNYACHTKPDYTRCRLFKDWAPYSFEFVMEVKDGNGFKRWFNGGLIFHGNHDGYGSGEAPTFSVCLNPTDGWSIHT